MKADDLPVGTRVVHNGRTFTRDQRGIQGWVSMPEGFFINSEIDTRIADGATVTLPKEKP